MSDNPMFMYVGDYESIDDAKADLAELKQLHREHVVGTFDAAVLTKDEKGKVKVVEKIERPTQHGAELAWRSARRSASSSLPRFWSAGWQEQGPAPS